MLPKDPTQLLLQKQAADAFYFANGLLNRSEFDSKTDPVDIYGADPGRHP